MPVRVPCVAFLSAGLLASAASAAQPAGADWPTYGHDAGGMRFSPLAQITPANVATLKPVWTLHMRQQAGVTQSDTPSDAGVQAQRQAEGAAPRRRHSRFAASEVTPLVVGDVMYITTPYHKALALKPETGEVLWSYDVPGQGQPSLRGVEYWPGDGRTGPRIVFGTRDSRLIALNARTGKAAEGFGVDGVVDLRTPEILNGSHPDPNGYGANVGMTSPPIVYKNLVITGSAVQEAPALGPAGDVRAWDMRTGKLVWTFHTVPRPGEFGHDTWAGHSWKGRSGTNVWGLMTVDEARGLVFLPVAAPTWDRWGGDRHGANLFGTTLVAVDAATGKRVWHFQVVHHDIWDSDLQAPPTLIDVKHGGRTIPALVIVSKAGLMFILDRTTGKPIYGVQERPVPKSDVPGEEASPTQPFPLAPEPLVRMTMTKADIADNTPELKAFCEKLVADNNILLGGPYLPASFKRTTVNWPGTQGGANWGGGAFDPRTGLYVVNVLNLGQLLSIVPSDRPGMTFQNGQPSGRFWQPDTHLPCQKGPWGELVAVDVNTARIAWRSTLGVSDNLPEGKQNTGRPSMGGPIVTAGGLVFIGGADDGRFRAFDERTGKEVWTYKLAASAHATPSTYQGADGRQYVVVVSTGGSFLDSPLTDDSVTAFALPAPSRS